MPHVREVDPMPHLGNWSIGCRCGWKSSVEVKRFPDKAGIMAALDDQFVGHLPADQRQLALKVDATPVELDDGSMGILGCWIVPEGKPAKIERFWGDDRNGFYAVIETGQEFPVHEVRTADGRVFKAE